MLKTCCKPRRREDRMSLMRRGVDKRTSINAQIMLQNLDDEWGTFFQLLFQSGYRPYSSLHSGSHGLYLQGSPRNLFRLVFLVLVDLFCRRGDRDESCLLVFDLALPDLCFRRGDRGGMVGGWIVVVLRDSKKNRDHPK